MENSSINLPDLNQNTVGSNNIVKKFILPVTVLIFLIIGFIIYSQVFKNNPVVIPVFDTYKSSQCNLKLQYPETWTVSPNCGTASLKNIDCIQTKDFDDQSIIEGQTTGRAILVACRDADKIISNQALLNQCTVMSKLPANDHQVFECKTVKIGNYEFVVREQGFYQTVKNNRIYMFSVKPEDKPLDESVTGIFSSLKIQ